ncbi:dipeptidase [Clostridium massiliamazoniense]|uniref:dipeptidase n=1 Tax=Clostridium massiliamazoniense TaxID=1347366 RepID=UPI0006D81B35|nr:dipeptidase [Clostridium massiliamazoniense]
MNFIDFHCDTAYRMIEEGKNITDSNLKANLNNIKAGNAMAQFFAMFIEKDQVEDSFKYCNKMLLNFKKEISKHEDTIELCRNFDDLKRVKASGKIGAFLTIEEGDALKGNLDNLRYFKEEGISLVTLTWNFENDLGYPNVAFVNKDKGLKEKGIEAVEEMNRLGMLIDVSHLSDGGFFDVAKYSKMPFIASHSNARVMTNHSRNLTDEMIKILANKGGVTGINFCNAFLSKDSNPLDDEVATIKNMVRHIKHIRNVGGIEVIGIGSDFDGIENEVEIKNSSEMNKLAFALQKEGFVESEIEKIFYGNALRIIKDVLR